MSNYTDIGSARQGGDFVGFVVGTDSRQMTMGVWSIEDEVAQDSPARFIEVFVDSLDLEEMGFRARRARGDGPAGVPSRRPAEAVSLRLYEQDPLLPESHAGVRTKCGAVVSAEPAAAGLPHHRGLPHGAPKAAQKDISSSSRRSCREMKLMDGETLCLDGTTIRAVQRPKAVHQRGAQPEEAGVRPGAAGGRGALSGRHGRKRPPRGSDRPSLRAGSGQGPSARPADAPGAHRLPRKVHRGAGEIRPKRHDLHRPGMRHDARQGGRNQGLLQRPDRGGRVQPHDRRFPRHGQPQRPGTDLREHGTVPEESGAGIGERHRRQGLRERRGHRELPPKRRGRGRGLHSGPGGAGVLAGLRRAGDRACSRRPPRNRRTFRPVSAPACCRTATKTRTSACRCSRWGRSAASSATRTAR